MERAYLLLREAHDGEEDALAAGEEEEDGGGVRRARIAPTAALCSCGILHTHLEEEGRRRLHPRARPARRHVDGGAEVGAAMWRKARRSEGERGLARSHGKGAAPEVKYDGSGQVAAGAAVPLLQQSQREGRGRGSDRRVEVRAYGLARVAILVELRAFDGSGRLQGATRRAEWRLPPHLGL